MARCGCRVGSWRMRRRGFGGAKDRRQPIQLIDIDRLFDLGEFVGLFCLRVLKHIVAKRGDQVIKTGRLDIQLFEAGQRIFGLIFLGDAFIRDGVALLGVARQRMDDFALGSFVDHQLMDQCRKRFALVVG